jgi:hypothetical protein
VGNPYVLVLQHAFLSLSGNPGGIPAIRSQILARGLSSLDHKYHNIRILLYERSVNICIVMEFGTPTSAARSKRS